MAGAKRQSSTGFSEGYKMAELSPPAGGVAGGVVEGVDQS